MASYFDPLKNCCTDCHSEANGEPKWEVSELKPGAPFFQDSELIVKDQFFGGLIGNPESQGAIALPRAIGDDSPKLFHGHETTPSRITPNHGEDVSLEQSPQCRNARRGSLDSVRSLGQKGLSRLSGLKDKLSFKGKDSSKAKAPTQHMERRDAPSGDDDFTQELMKLRKRHSATDREKIKETVVANSDAHKRASTIFISKDRYTTNKTAITRLADVSPLKVIPAEKAIHFCATHLGRGNMDAKDFMNLLQNLVQTMGVSEKVKEHDIAAVFNVLDFDQTGHLDHSLWISAIPEFFSGSVDDMAAIVFKEIDEDASGVLDFHEFAKYTTFLVNMIVPPENPQFREEVKSALAKIVFNAIDIDGNGTLSAQEFSEWSERNSLEKEALRIFEEHVKNRPTSAVSW